MPEVRTEKSLVVRANAPKVLTAGVIPPGVVVLHVEAEGVAHYVKFGPAPLDFDQGEAIAISILRCIAKARAMNEVSVTPLVVVPAAPSTLPPPKEGGG